MQKNNSYNLWIVSVGPYQSKVQGASEFEGVSLSGPVIFSKEVFINSVIGSLETRLKDLRDAENIVRATRIADLTSCQLLGMT